jgi:hypothetical protein
MEDNFMVKNSKHGATVKTLLMNLLTKQQKEPPNKEEDKGMGDQIPLTLK